MNKEQIHKDAHMVEVCHRNINEDGKQGWLTCDKCQALKYCKTKKEDLKCPCNNTCVDGLPFIN